MFHTYKSRSTRELRSPTTEEFHRHVCELKSQHTMMLALSRNLDISMASPVQLCNFKGCEWGPCTSDMTLVVEDENNQPHQMPIIRHEHFFEFAWRVPMEKIPLVVGNEKPSLHKTQLQSVDLGTFLDNISVYTDLRCSSLKEAMFSDAVVTSQTCVLPIQRGGKVNFHVELFNYHQDPPVLVILGTSKGTSVQVLDRQNAVDGFRIDANRHRHGQKLWFNNAGQKCTFTGTMEASEKESDVIVVVQVPLIRKQRAGDSPIDMIAHVQTLVEKRVDEWKRGSGRHGVGGGSGVGVGSAPPTPVEGLGQTQGSFPALKDYNIARDDLYPVRVTIQWCKSAANGEVDAEVIDSIAQKMKEAKSRADWWRSLVVGNFQKQRPTPWRHSLCIDLKPDGYCDKCGRLIFGIKHRRLECPNIDLCQPCGPMMLHGHMAPYGHHTMHHML
ncbi:hypothetical protein BSKO_12664 [Bryopsis sp. KO-2023]|nr:hypothetical protein BSKO_12664 [Bryopsis sp. KO-2023]